MCACDAVANGDEIGFAAEGASVVISARSASRGGEVAQEIKHSGGHGQFVAADLNGTARASRDLSNVAFDALGGRIDVLINIAGIFRAQPRRP